jgi:hypothetical protein
MNLDALGNLGEIIGAGAVVLSLIYLAVQVRQSTQSQRTENYARALDRLAAFQSLLSQDGHLSRVFAKGAADTSTLTPQERIQFTWSAYEAFGAFEFMFHASRTGSIPDEVWQRWSLTVAWWLSFPGVRHWWSARPVPFTSGFSAWVDATIADNPFDKDAAARWQHFIGSGKPRA